MRKIKAEEVEAVARFGNYEHDVKEDIEGPDRKGQKAGGEK